MAIDGGLGQEILRLWMDVQQPFYPEAQRGVVAAGLVQIVRPLRHRFLLERGEEDRFHTRGTAHGMTPILRRILSEPLKRCRQEIGFRLRILRSSAQSRVPSSHVAQSAS